MTHSGIDPQPLSWPPDAEIVQEARNGRPQGLGLLVERYYGLLIGFFRYLRVPPDLVEDLGQETFIRAFLNLDQFQVERRFSAWLLTIGRHLYCDVLRKQSRERAAYETLPREAPPADLEGEVIRRLTARELLAALSPEAKLLVELRIWQGFSFSEIAELTGEGESTLRVRFFRIMGRLRLAREGEEQHVP
jgi:RNA polymerase sigma-70 factor (ECF subfamily)